VATVCVQTGLNLACHILENPCQYVRCHCLNFFRDVCFQGVYVSWFILVNSPFQISIRNNQAASGRASAVAKVPSKWHSHQKRTEFRPCRRVKCVMSLHLAGNIHLRVPHDPFDLKRCWRFPYMQRGTSGRKQAGYLADRCSVSQQLGELRTHSSSFLTQQTYSCSNFISVSSLVLELLKKCRVR